MRCWHTRCRSFWGCVMRAGLWCVVCVVCMMHMEREGGESALSVL